MVTLLAGGARACSHSRGGKSHSSLRSSFPGVMFSVMLAIITRRRAASLGVLQGTCGQACSEAPALREGNACAAFLLCTSQGTAVSPSPSSACLGDRRFFLLPHPMGHFSCPPSCLLSEGRAGDPGVDRHVSGSGCLTLTTFTCVFVAAADKRICSLRSTHRVSHAVSQAGNSHTHSSSQVQKGPAAWKRLMCCSCTSDHGRRDEVQLLIIMQKTSLNSASPAVALKIFSIGVIVCFPSLCACNPKHMLESIQMLHLCRYFPMTGFWFKDNLASRHNLVQLQLAVGLRRHSDSYPLPHVICQTCISFDSAL